MSDFERGFAAGRRDAARGLSAQPAEFDAWGRLSPFTRGYRNGYRSWIRANTPRPATRSQPRILLAG